MARSFARRLEGLPAPATIEMARRARALRAEGKPVISLALGEPDFPTPPAVVEAAHAAALAGQTKYPPVDGTPALKAAVARKFTRENGLDYAPDEIMVSNGGKQVIFNAFMATLNPGDEVVVPAPYWVSYPLIARMFSGVPVTVPCREEDGFKLKAEALAGALTPKSRWLVLNFPNNPTGAVMTAQELEAIAEIVRQYPDLWVLSDEIYEHLVFDGVRSASLAAVAPDLKDRIITLNGVSKAYAMTGWRIGFAAAPVEFTKQLIKLQGQSTSNPCSIAQAAAQEAVSGPQDFISEMVAVYQERRNLVIGMLNDAPGLTCALPEGAFYAFPSIAGVLGKTSKGGRLIESDEAFVTALLEETGVAAVHGTAFLTPGYFRISYATSTDLLVEACTRIQKFCQGLS